MKKYRPVWFFFCFLVYGTALYPGEINVLFISSFEPGSARTSAIAEGIAGCLQNNDRRIQFYIESLDAYRFPLDEKARKAVEESIERRLGGIDFDFILAQADPALDFSVFYRRTHASGIPIVAFDLIDYQYEVLYAEELGLYGRYLTDFLVESFRLAAKVFPRAGKGIFLFSNTATKDSFREIERLRKEFPTIKIEYGLDGEENEARLKEAGPDSFALLFADGWKLPNGKLHFGKSIVEHITTDYGIPVFGMLRNFFGSGLIGGRMFNYDMLSKELSSMIERILDGAHPPSRWDRLVAAEDVFDYRVLRRFGVSSDRLPKGARVEFMPPDPWIRYEIPLKIAGGFLILLVSVSLYFLLLRRQKSRMLKLANASLELTVQERTAELLTSNAELEAANASLKDTLERIEKMQEILIEETREVTIGRLAMGIAHEVNNPLGAIQASSASLLQVVSPGPGSVVEAIVGLDRNQRVLFLDLLRHAASPDLDDEPEAMRLRKELAGRLGRLGIADAVSLADELVDLHLDGLDDERLAELAAPEAEPVLEALYRISVVSRSASVISDAVEKAKETVEAVRSYSRDVSLRDETETLNVVDTLERTLLLFRNETKNGVEIVRNFDPSIPPVRAKETRLMRLWTNLVQNGLQAMSYRGRLGLTAFRRGSDVVVEVSDSGSGLEETVREKLFQPFVSTKAPDEGIGLGLTMCKRIVDDMGGTIEFETREDGTVFRVSLPIGAS